MAGADTTKIAEHMEVVGSDGGHVGIVDKVEGDWIKLTRRDEPDGKHRWLPLAAVASVEDGRVVTGTDHAEARSMLQADDEPDAATPNPL